MNQYVRVKGYSSLLFIAGVTTTTPEGTFTHLYCPRMKNLRTRINWSQRKSGKDDNLYGGWCEVSRILKVYHKLPRKLKKKISKRR